MTKTNITMLIIAVLSVILLMFVVFKSCDDKPLPPIIHTQTDTVKTFIRDTITFSKPGKIVFTATRDTFFILAGDSTKPDTIIIKEHPNISSCIDTILPRAKGFDTLHICYKYPENMFNYKLKGTTDYIQINNTTNTMANIKTISPWWYFGGGLGVGILTSILIMKAVK